MTRLRRSWLKYAILADVGLIVLAIGLGIVLDDHEGPSSIAGFAILLLVGLLLTAGVRWWGTRGDAPPLRPRDMSMAVFGLICLLTGVPYLIFENPGSGAAMVASGVILVALPLSAHSPGAGRAAA